MTYLKTALIASVTALAATSVAHAGEDGDWDKDGDKMKAKATQSMNAKSMKTMDRNMMHPSKVNDTTGEQIQADGQPSIQSDREYLTHDGDMKTHKMKPSMHSEIAQEAIVVPGSANTLTTVSCPEGTTAQPDMTCMMTGDYDLTTASTTYNTNTAVAGAVDYDRTRTNYSLNTEYKGTLRPDSVIVENVDTDFDGMIDLDTDMDRDVDMDRDIDVDTDSDDDRYED